LRQVKDSELNFVHVKKRNGCSRSSGCYWLEPWPGGAHVAAWIVQTIRKQARHLRIPRSWGRSEHIYL